MQAGGGARGSRGFLAHSGLNLAGPLRASVRLRASAGGTLSLAWRTTEEKDFTAGNTVRVSVTASAEWQTLTFDVPATSRVIHVRLHPPEGDAVAIAEIALAPAGGGTPQVWDFASLPRSR